MEFDSADDNNGVTTNAEGNQQHREDASCIAADHKPVQPEPSHYSIQNPHGTDSHSHHHPHPHPRPQQQPELHFHSPPPPQPIPNYNHNNYQYYPHHHDLPSPYHNNNTSSHGNCMNHQRSYAPHYLPPPPSYPSQLLVPPSPAATTTPPPRPFLETPSHQPPPPSSSRTLASATTLAAAGALLGWTAAATMQWLNGDDDDWYFLHRRRSLTMAHSNPTTSTTTTTDHVPTDNETTAKSHPVTDQAMEYLRQRQQQQEDDDDDDTDRSKSDTKSQLQGIQKSLRTIQESLRIITNETTTPRHDVPVVVVELAQPAVQTQLSSVLDQLDHLLRSFDIISPNHETRPDTVVTVEYPTTTFSDTTTPEPPIPTHTTGPDASMMMMTTGDPDSVAIVDESPVMVVVDDDDDDGATSMTFTTTFTTTTRTALYQALTRLVQSRPERTPDEFRAGVQTLYLFTRNLSSHPLVPRYRRIYCDNDNYQNHVVHLSGAFDLLAAVGFVVPSGGGDPAPHPSKSRTSKYWDWSPILSLSSSQPPNTMSSEEQKGVEGIYLERLRDAVAALEVLKVASHDTDDVQLLEEALTAAGFRRDPDTGM